ncbi:Pentatricopeptide repeat-containing protein [Thalictrum thalictroides]|uniref:Pentatricopeptide repeat-containing protein n=1 Tax=Thalictrum thalictroides TaxID=46969 RepID=A0A7J6WP00_THATH|nr:Pentatricopeptide repeat-containing protein [Thalictrum thalictroides]
MATSSIVSTTVLDLHNSKNKPIFLFSSSPYLKHPNKRFLILCNSSKSTSKSISTTTTTTTTPSLVEEQQPHESLSEQLKPLSLNLLSDTQLPQPPLLTKPKSTWVNPSKPKRSVLSLQRHQRSSYSLNPKLKDLKLFAKKLNDCDPNVESELLAALEEIPYPPTRENSLLILNILKPWQKALFFFNWLKTQNLFPIETIFYNVTMKSLRFGRQFELIEELAHEMIENKIELDNITYSTIISCAKRCNLFDKAVEWFERMYKTGLMPDEVTYSAVLDVYAKLGKVEEVLNLYERGRASGWKPDHIAFSVLGKMFGEAGDYDGIRYVLEEMKSVGVEPNLVVYNTLLEGMGKAGKPGLARNLFEEMVAAGVTPNEKTLTALVKIYGKARWGRDALALWERMRSNGWPMDFILYNTLLSMCASLALEEEAEKLFEDMKGSPKCKPDSWSYAAMLNIYGSGGKVEKAMSIFEEMSKFGVKLNVMGCTCLIQCLGRAKRFQDVVRVYNIGLQRGIQPDDRLCGCLLSVVTFCGNDDEVGMILSCLERANPKLVAFVKILGEEKLNLDRIKEEFKQILNEVEVEVRRPYCLLLNFPFSACFTPCEFFNKVSTT